MCIYVYVCIYTYMYIYIYIYICTYLFTYLMRLRGQVERLGTQQLVELLKSQPTTRFTIFSDYKAFSKVPSRLNFLHQMAI